MRISISKKQSGSLGESTQVKIVIPSSSSSPKMKSSSPKKNLSNKDEDILPSHSPTMDMNAFRKKKIPTKNTARKTMSSFTPRAQPYMLPKSYHQDVVTLDSDDDKDTCVLDSAPHLEKNVLPSNSSKNFFNLANENLVSLDTKKKTVRNTPNSEVNVSDSNQLKSTKISNAGKNNTDSSKSQLSLDFYIENFKCEWKKYLNREECEKVQKKVEKRVSVISNQYRSSTRLHEFISMKTRCIRDDRKKVFPVIKDVLDELTKYGQKNTCLRTALKEGEPTKKKRIALIPSSDNVTATSSIPPTSKTNTEFSVGEDNLSSPKSKHTDAQMVKRKGHINKLERALKACGKEIQRCEEEELSLSDMEEDDSAYLKVSRYKARYMKIYNKIAQLRKLDSSLQRQQDKRFRTEASRIPEINAKIEDIVNKSKMFPDYADILKLYQAHYQKNGLLVEKEIMKVEGKDI